ncbi:putative ribosomal protein S5 domain 2-type [Septoria linicola]|nr:putative ribosomal protein S5 domain 2-type [Septoria linicola]
MGITALPQATVRVLGASQVLTDPAAVVKELLDNAYDANATSIAIEIHSNTIDVIQVRDNGHGIAPEDRALIARRYCTSKISHDDELKDIGGSSLGFRGEALASAAELSGSLTISTKIEGEQIAAALKISQTGEVVGQDKASLPVGTTVRITDFVKANPVRRQVVLKNAESCLKKIKHTLQAYAFARPHVRLALRVLKAKNNKSDWIYAPKPNGNAEDAAFKVVGAACASQCTWSVLESSGFGFQAFLPRLDAIPNKVGNIGAFISVDARPVSAFRGTFKQILKIFREALRSAAPEFGDVKDPFLYLELSCPRGSYDANLEPAKDDLLFEDASLVIKIARQLFAAAYETQQSSEMRPETADMPRQQLQQHLDDVASSTPVRPSTNAGSGAQDLTTHTPALNELRVAGPQDTLNHEDWQPRRPPYRSNMYGCDEEDLDAFDQRSSSGGTEADFEELRRSKGDVNVSNPWITAKLNASVRDHTSPAKEQGQADVHTFTAPLPTLSSPIKAVQRRTLASETLPTPRPSSPSPEARFHPSDHVSDIRLARDGRLIGSSSLPEPQSYGTTLPTDAAPRRAHDYNLPAQMPQGTPLEAIPVVSAKPRRSPNKALNQAKINRPFVSPMIEGPPRENVWFDHLQDADRPKARARRGGGAAGYSSNNGSALVVEGELGDLVDDPRALTPPPRNRDIRDFVAGSRSDSITSMIERRNYGRAAPARRGPQTEHQTLDLPEVGEDEHSLPQQRGFVRASEVTNYEQQADAFAEPLKPAPKRRRTSGRAALAELNANPPRMNLEQLDEEEYRPNTSKRPLSRRKSSNKLGRTKSSRLPLERTPAGQGTHALSLNCRTSPRAISELAVKTGAGLNPVSYNEVAVPKSSGLDAASSQLISLTHYLHRLLVDIGGHSDITSPEALLSEVKAAFAQRDETTDAADDEEMLMSLAT